MENLNQPPLTQERRPTVESFSDLLNSPSPRSVHEIYARPMRDAHMIKPPWKHRELEYPAYGNVGELAPVQWDTSYLSSPYIGYHQQPDYYCPKHLQNGAEYGHVGYQRFPPADTSETLHDWRFEQDAFSSNWNKLNSPVTDLDTILKWNQYHLQNGLPAIPRFADTYEKWFPTVMQRREEVARDEVGVVDEAALRYLEPPKGRWFETPRGAAWTTLDDPRKVDPSIVSGIQFMEPVTPAKVSHGTQKVGRDGGMSIRDRRMARQREGTRKSSRKALKS